MKKIFTVLCSSVIALSLAACGQANDEETANIGGGESGNNTAENSGEENTGDTNDTENTYSETTDNSENNSGENNSGNNFDESDRPDEIVMGFVPSQDSDKIADTVEPLAERLSEELGVTVTGQVMTNYTALVEAMGNDQVQVGFIPAFGYVLATERYDHIEAILKSIRHGSSTYKAQYVVNADSEYESLEDLEGSVWAFPDLASTSGYLFPAAQLMDDYGAEDVESFFSDMIQAGSHDNALVTLIEGDADVATTFDDARGGLEEDYPEIFEETRILGYTDDIPNDTISVNTNSFSQDFIDQITEVFLAFNEDEEMIEIMDEVYNWTGIDTADDADYDVVRTLYEYFSDSVSLD